MNNQISIFCDHFAPQMLAGIISEHSTQLLPFCSRSHSAIVNIWYRKDLKVNKKLMLMLLGHRTHSPSVSFSVSISCWFAIQSVLHQMILFFLLPIPLSNLKQQGLWLKYSRISLISFYYLLFKTFTQFLSAFTYLFILV